MRRVLAPFALLAVTGIVVACAAPEQQQVRPHKSSSRVDDREDDDDDAAPVPTTMSTSEDTPVPPIDAGSGTSATTYVGTLATTRTVRFGGSPFCSYDVALKSVQIELAALPTGQVIGARVTDTMVEAVVPPCSLSPAPPSNQSFAFTTATQTADGYQLAFNGGSGNRPKTKLVVDIEKVGAAYEASAIWQRTDQKAPLAWTVTAKVTLEPR